VTTMDENQVNLVRPGTENAGQNNPLQQNETVSKPVANLDEAGNPTNQDKRTSVSSEQLSKDQNNVLLPGLAGLSPTGEKKPTAVEKLPKLGDATPNVDPRTNQNREVGGNAPALATDSEGTISNVEGSKYGDNPNYVAHGEPRNNNETNQDGQPLPAGATDGSNVAHTETGETTTLPPGTQVVKDRVSGHDVVVTSPVVNVENQEEFKRLLDEAHKSLGDSKIGEVGTGHPYWGLMERARQFGKQKGLLT
jgi:hypothetical protein